MLLARGPVLGVQGHEVLDVGRHQRASGAGGVGQDLVVGKRGQRRICDDGRGVVAFGAESCSAMAAESISSSSSG